MISPHLITSHPPPPRPRPPTLCAPQLSTLPDTSARVNTLLRVAAFYLQPWAQPAATPAKSAAAASPFSAPSSSSSSAAAAAAAAGQGVVASGNPESWAYAGFVQRNFMLYARLLGSVASECRASRFELGDKKDMAMLLGVCALFLQPHAPQLVQRVPPALPEDRAPPAPPWAI